MTTINLYKIRIRGLSGCVYMFYWLVIIITLFSLFNDSSLLIVAPCIMSFNAADPLADEVLTG